jgi:dephospho-CoA kinase
VTESENGQLSTESRDQASHVKVWGLTGGIASGKSTVAKFLAEQGIPVIDADQVSRELSSPGGMAHAAILARFGTDDRALIREKVFKDLEARRDLEAILHPMIRQESMRRIQQFTGPVIYEATLLVETGRYKDFAGLLVVEAPLEARKTRLVLRDALPERLADQIIAAQLSDAERRKVATVVIQNDGDLEKLRAQVGKVASYLKSKSR